MYKRKDIILFIILCISGLFFVALFNFIFDPFQQFRIKTFYPVYYSEKSERYRNAGFIKNYDYESLILGASVTENLVISQVQNILDYKKTIKLCVSGGSGKELGTTLQSAIDSNSNLKKVLWGLDILSFSGKPDRLMFGEGSFPFYLYEDSYLTLYKYLFSLDTFSKSIEAYVNQYIKSENDPLFDFDRMYQWQHVHNHNFTLNNVLRKWETRKKSFSTSLEDQKIIYLKNNFNKNILSIIRKNPSIKFQIYFPPYPILFFVNAKENGLLEDFLLFKKYISDQIGSLKNVEIYDFQDVKNVTHDFKNYRDLTHFHHKVDIWILEQIRNKKYKITENNNMNMRLEKLNKQVEQFDINKVYSIEN